MAKPKCTHHFTQVNEELERPHPSKKDGVSEAMWASVRAEYPAGTHRSKSEWPLGWPWKLLTCFFWEPRSSSAMHTFPIVRDIDRAVRGTPSSIVRNNRGKLVWVSGWRPTGHRQEDSKPSYAWVINGLAGMAQRAGHWGTLHCLMLHPLQKSAAAKGLSWLNIYSNSTRYHKSPHLGFLGFVWSVSGVT